MFKLETDLRSIQVAQKTGDTASYVYASYTRTRPIPAWTPHSPYDIVPYSLTLPTFVSDARVRRLEPGVFYKLPEDACRSLGSDESLSLIPLYVELSHVPYVDFVEDEHGRAYVPNSATGVRDDVLHLSRLCYGAWTVCGLLRTGQAREWAGLSKTDWFVYSLFGKARNGLDPSWQPLRAGGSVSLSFRPPLLRRPVEVSRETA